MRKFLLGLLVAGVGLIASTAFGQERLVFSNGLLAIAVWESAPAPRVENKLTLQFQRVSDLVAASPEESVSVELWMPSMNHGSRPTVTKAIPGVVGGYEVSKIYFVMGGDWDVRVHLTAPNGQRETQSLQLVLPGGHHE